MNWYWLIALLAACIVTALVESWRWQRNVRLIEADRDRWRREAEMAPELIAALGGMLSWCEAKTFEFEPGKKFKNNVPIAQALKVLREADEATREGK